ncbi:hypothetical protein B0A48_18869, partial [Cryoendolithus antarcticus]
MAKYKTFVLLAAVASAQRTDPSLTEARIALSIGEELTFEPSTDYACQWAVLEYFDNSTQFIDLASNLTCIQDEQNVSSTLRLVFGHNVAPGNASVLVQCQSPLTFEFFVGNRSIATTMTTSLYSLCDNNADAISGMSDSDHAGFAPSEVQALPSSGFASSKPESGFDSSLSNSWSTIATRPSSMAGSPTSGTQTSLHYPSAFLP